MNEKDYLKQLDGTTHVTTKPYILKCEEHTENYTTDVFGKEIIVFPGVMSPEYDWAGLYMIDYMPQDFTGQDVLEVGPGTGLVSVFAGLRGARSITAIDINPQAIENTLANFEKFDVKNSSAFISDVFKEVSERKFDTIIFNLPYHDGEPQSDLEKGVIDQDYKAMKDFFKDAKKFISKDGTLYIGFSQSGNVPLFLETVAENGFEITDMQEKNKYDGMPRFADGEDFHYNCQVYTLKEKL